MINKTQLLIIFLMSMLIGCNSPNKPAKHLEGAKQVEQGVTHPNWSRNANIYEVNIRQYT